MTPNSKSNLEKEKRSWRNQAPCLQTILQSYSHQYSMVLAQKEQYRSMEQDRKLMHRNLLHSCTLMMKNLKEKLKKHSHLPLQQKE